MENLAPPLELIMELRFQIEKGQSVKRSLLAYIEQDPMEPWRQSLLIWVKQVENNRLYQPIHNSHSLQRRHCLSIIARGLKGESIYPQLCSLEEELYRAASLELDEHIATLPIKSLIPLLFFQFPALILMIIGPLLSSFFQH
jgi:hypothetical protein